MSSTNVRSDARSHCLPFHSFPKSPERKLSAPYRIRKAGGSRGSRIFATSVQQPTWEEEQEVTKQAFTCCSGGAFFLGTSRQETRLWLGKGKLAQRNRDILCVILPSSRIGTASVKGLQEARLVFVSGRDWLVMREREGRERSCLVFPSLLPLQPTVQRRRHLHRRNRYGLIN
jgi:hypothetical protein